MMIMRFLVFFFAKNDLMLFNQVMMNVNFQYQPIYYWFLFKRFTKRCPVTISQIISLYLYKTEITKDRYILYLSWGKFKVIQRYFLDIMRVISVKWSRSIRSNRATVYGMNLHLREMFRKTLWMKVLCLFNPTSRSLFPIQTFHSS